MFVSEPYSEKHGVVASSDPTPRLVGNTEFLWFCCTMYLQGATESTK